MSLEPHVPDLNQLAPQTPKQWKGRALDDEATVFRTMIDHVATNVVLLLVDEKQRFPVVAANAVALAQLSGQEVLGRSAFDFMLESLHKQSLERFLHCCRNHETIKYQLSEPYQGQTIWYETEIRPVIDESGTTTHLLVSVSNITDRKGQEIQLQEQHELILRQHEALNELSTPLLSISDNTVVLPLIGSIDSQRIQQLISSLLEGIATRKAEHVIIDITGVPIVDTQVANALIQATQAVKLLGAQVILSGIRPEVAQTLVGLGIDFGTLLPQATLQSAIARTLAN